MKISTSQAIYIFGHDFTSEIRDLQDCCLLNRQMWKSE